MPTRTAVPSFLRLSAGSDETSSPELPVSTEQILRNIAAAGLVGIGYYVGTRIGFALTPISQPNSAFWPPNAILLAAFLLAPRRMWLAFLLAVLPAHMFAQLQTGVPVWTATGWFISNTGEALIGALCITHFAPQDRVFDSVRGLFVFLVFGVLIAPFATSFLDAGAVVVTGWGRGYWPLGSERFWTNALAEMTVVPSIVLCSARGASWIRKATFPQLWEAGLLAVGIVLVSVLVFGFPPALPAATPALFFAPLPLLLWTTIRFGSAGLSLSLLCVALVSIWCTIHGRRPFPAASMPQNILAMQIFFCMVAVLLMVLAAVMADARRTQEALQSMSGGLIEAQEQERYRIGRELHDDINQRLAMLALELQQLQDDPSDIPNRVQELRKRTTEISNDVQALSHDLHSSKLEYLGVVAGIKSWCKEFADRQGMKIDFDSDVHSLVPPKIGLPLFRVLQEALHNVIKHSGVREVEVGLREDSGGIRMVVRDFGRGFDLNTALQGKGLGLTSMRERIRLVNGTISIEAQPTKGTTIHIHVPLEAKYSS